MVEAWRGSGLPLATFARERGLSAERIRWWRQRLGGWGRRSGEERAQLVPAVVAELPPARAATAGVSVIGAPANEAIVSTFVLRQCGRL